MKAQVIAPVGRWHRLILVMSLLTVTVIGLAAPSARPIPELNFIKAEIPVVLKALADFTGTNIVVGPAVKGEITIRLKGVTLEDALDIITQMSGLAYAKTDNAYVVNLPGSLPQGGSGKAGDISTVVVSLKYLSNAEAIKTLSIAFRDVQTSEIGSRLILAGNANRLEAAEGFLTGLDTPDARSGQATTVVTLKYTAAEKATQTLGMLFPDVTIKTVDARQVALIGEKNRVANAKAMLAELDIAPSAEQSVPGLGDKLVEKTYRVRYVVPWQAKEYLEYAFNGKALTVSFAPDILDAVPSAPQPAQPAATRATPAAAAAAVAKSTWSSRTLVLRGTAGVVDEALASLARVDIEVPAVEKRCTVQRIFATQAIAYLLDIYEKQDLAISTAPMSFVQLIEDKEVTEAGAKVNKAKGDGQVGSVVRRNADGSLNVSEPIGDFILRGPAEVVNAAVKTLAQIDVGPERIDKVVKLQYLYASDVRKQLLEMYASKGLQIFLAPSQRVQEFKPSNNDGTSAPGAGTAANKIDEIADLVLRGPEEAVNLALRQIQLQDVAPAQVSIQTQVVSITSSALRNLGVEWGSPGAPGTVTVGLTEQQSGDPLQLGRIVRSPVTLTATLNALERSNKAKIINRPTSVVMNGRTSFIHVGDVIYYEEFRGYDQQGNKIFSQTSLNTGVTLNVRPIVSPDGIITLEIQSAVTEEPVFVAGVASLLPRFRANATTTTVQVRDGETLIIGGLMQTTEKEQRQGVPVLSRIPLIGALFTSKQTTPSQTELLIMVTPNLIQPGIAITAPAGIVLPAAE